MLEWITQQRQQHPSLSYTAMASLLDQADIPTLGGRQGWHRGSVRNLVAKEQQPRTESDSAQEPE
ncbi:MAG: hypothetical protein JXR59_02785 [Desulfuromonadaceae bacterium]|nr:hypothetical protein [Desulfuromonadaceae bacterium]